MHERSESVRMLIQAHTHYTRHTDSDTKADDSYLTTIQFSIKIKLYASVTLLKLPQNQYGTVLGIFGGPVGLGYR